MSDSLRIPSSTHSPFLRALLEGEFEEGLRLHEAMPSTETRDDIWLALCLMHLGRRAEALGILLKLRAAGLEDAAPVAAIAYRFEGSLEMATELLADLDAWRLTSFGEAVAWRERSMLAFASGCLGEALAAAQRAWRIAVIDETASLFLPGFASALALVLSTLGQDHAASSYIRQALPLGSAAQRAPLLWTLAGCLARAGDFGAAQEALTQVQATPLSSQAQPLLSYHRGVLARLQGIPEEAVAAFSQSASLARQSGQLETEVYAAASLSAIAAEQGKVAEARVHLSRAHHRAVGARAEALCAFQEATLQASEDHTKAIDQLQSCARRLSQLGLRREVGEAWIVIADTYARQGEDGAALTALRSVAEARAALGANVTLATSVDARPALRRLLVSQAAQGHLGSLCTLWEDFQQLQRSRPAALALTTLGGYGLRLGELPVKLNVGMRRAVELLAYLLLRKEATLEQLQTYVFEQCAPQAARDYLHVARHGLTRAVPGLQLPFDRDRGVYRVTLTGRPLHWDVALVRAALQEGTPGGVTCAAELLVGPFLPWSAATWAAEERAELEWELQRVGVRVARDLQARGQPVKSERILRALLRVHPTELALHELLAQAVQASQGNVAANLEKKHSQLVLERELDVPVLTRLD
ncbi:hypothetical protein [Deinococcus soli (ex Cha et al. 2016)]|uniref:Tetratricopeptide (TPR) repeat protein n=2 Tax=Deinococcus soli (ex Cha et al. 2016) TaxID=1309411 RepID=A0ACC6KM66_9DEIO|nr:hypothetical protein [Deinococcus soli (ex Cha et al. 2016)]MDR6220955.1 tetratricopeptide (TPR) repeat protein [Deinococcus soli (ex Cha et al. 2016)]MDR6330949.1 tetratricopeptide (TPR) repeat protein [Deinococcus soli (ex Cha et al. 2016)]MDR6753678.1 tetratricopeptide (TPR) repeat protein [Deinococcus soli (ex Cha et al. 2016)]